VIKINMVRHLDGLSATYSETTVDTKHYHSSKILGIKDHDGNPVVQMYREGSVYNIMIQLLEAGYAGEVFQVLEDGKIIMNGILNYKHIPTSYKP